jgi:hypothetical protein
MLNRKEMQRLNWIKYEDTRAFVCGRCVQEPFLNEHKIKELFQPRVCIGCGTEVAHAFDVSYLADRCREKLPNYFEFDYGLYPGYELHLRDVLKRALSCSVPAVLDKLAELLEIEEDEASEDDDDPPSKNFFVKWAEYQVVPSPFDDEEHERWHALGDWHRVEKKIAHGRRFSNRQADELFDGLIAEALSAQEFSAPEVRPAIKVLPVDFEFFRARISDTFDEQKSFFTDPAKCLGAPPKERAASGRMSAAGIPCLYLSGDPITCVAEVRPSIGDDVVVGRFKSTRELTLFDLTAFSKGVAYPTLSYFDPCYGERETYRSLLAHIHVELGRPVKVHNTDYLMTQALAEFIRFYRNGLFDGVAFQSVQNAEGVNYTLFDSSTEGEQEHVDWMPRFDVQIDVADVKAVKVGAVSYSMNPENPFDAEAARDRT